MPRGGVLEGRKAVVTGGAQGLGEAISERLAAEGADVAIGDIQGDACEALAERLAATYDVKAIGGAVDVTREDQVQAYFERADAAFGGLDLLVANAGILRAHPIDSSPLEDWRILSELNLTELIAAKQAQLMIPASAAPSCRSTASRAEDSFRNSAYAASKFGGIGLKASPSTWLPTGSG